MINTTEKQTKIIIYEYYVQFCSSARDVCHGGQKCNLLIILKFNTI